jgi:hypothetical protein
LSGGRCEWSLGRRPQRKVLLAGRTANPGQSTHLCLPSSGLRDHPLTAMPLTTPVSLSVSASTSSSSSSTFPTAVFVEEQPSSTGTHKHKQTDQFASTALDPHTTNTPVLTPAVVAARPNVHSRRLTLSRFPLLRKGSRELGRTPSTSAKASNTTTPPTHTQLLAPATLTSRASISTLRGSLSSSTVDGHEAPPSEEVDNSTKAAPAQRTARADKMHQTSSRLLRMTDDERPYTRVGHFSFKSRILCTSTRLGSISSGSMATFEAHATVSANDGVRNSFDYEVFDGVTKATPGFDR